MKKAIYLILLLLISIQLKAQVNDISFNLTPVASYTWWDNNLFIENGAMVGGMIGVGLGRNLELRGLYERSIDLNNSLNDLKVSDEIISNFNAQTVNIERWGGEFKANIPTKSILAPYLTLGSGVQKLKFNELTQEQIYISGGLGTKFNLGNRVTLNLEGKLHAFNMDPTNILRMSYTEEDDFSDIIENNITSERMMNWSLKVGVQFYLGGKNPKSYTALDRALEQQYSNGLKGLRFVLEPGGAFINFDTSTNLRNTYLLGGAIGLDFNEYVGLRGFYYQSVENEKISTDFDKMALYGADFIAKLNVARGVVPYISVGGGYMNVYGSYVGSISLLPANSSYFAKGGVGLTIPVSRYFEVFGAANLLLTTDKEDLVDLESTEDLKKHTMYNVGVKLNLGKAAKAGKTLDSYIDKRVSDISMMYEQRIAELKKELDKAYEANDAQKAARIINEKQRLEMEMVALAEKESVMNDTTTIQARYDGQPMIILTPTELESLIDKVLKGVEEPVLKKETPEERLDRLEKIVLGQQAPTTYSQQQPLTYSQQPNTTVSEESVASLVRSDLIEQQQSFIPKSIDNSNDELLREMQRINKRIDGNYMAQAASDKTFIIAPGSNQNPFGTSSRAMNQNQRPGQSTSWVIYKGLSPFVGVNFGDARSVVFGLKANYGFSSNRFVFTPDLYFGVGGKFAYGINANVTHPLYANMNSIFTPYVGVGLGINKVENFNFGINLIAGSYVDVGIGSLFLEYTSRRFFKNHLASIGYSFKF